MQANLRAAPASTRSGIAPWSGPASPAGPAAREVRPIADAAWEGATAKLTQAEREELDAAS